MSGISATFAASLCTMDASVRAEVHFIFFAVNCGKYGAKPSLNWSIKRVATSAGVSETGIRYVSGA